MLYIAAYDAFFSFTPDYSAYHIHSGFLKSENSTAETPKDNSSRQNVGGYFLLVSITFAIANTLSLVLHGDYPPSEEPPEQEIEYDEEKALLSHAQHSGERYSGAKDMELRLFSLSGESHSSSDEECEGKEGNFSSEILSLSNQLSIYLKHFAEKWKHKGEYKDSGAPVCSDNDPKNNFQNNIKEYSKHGRPQHALSASSYSAKLDYYNVLSESGRDYNENTPLLVNHRENGIDSPKKRNEMKENLEDMYAPTLLDAIKSLQFQQIGMY